jgi:hypothetical protein
MKRLERGRCKIPTGVEHGSILLSSARLLRCLRSTRSDFCSALPVKHNKETFHVSDPARCGSLSFRRGPSLVTHEFPGLFSALISTCYINLKRFDTARFLPYSNWPAVPRLLMVRTRLPGPHFSMLNCFIYI